jgi:hypothetical protein
VLGGRYGSPMLAGARSQRCIALASGGSLAAGGAACAALVVAGLFAGVAAGASQTCAQLRGRRLRSGSGVKVVQRGNRSKATAYVCVPPRGRVWSGGAASSTTDDGDFSIQVVGTAGKWVAIRFASSVGAAGDEADKAINASSGKSYRFWQESEGLGGEIGEVGHVVERIELDGSGQVALAVAEQHEGKTVAMQILAVDPNGSRRVLDSAPAAQLQASSLQLNGSSVQWVDAGTRRSATL